MTDTVVASHIYEPLGGPDHIRLICLEPAFFTQEPLRFSFLSGNLIDFEDHYEAISYTWGEPLLICPLNHNSGTQVMATANLDEALRRYRLPVTKRLLWADAVCINQKDDAEKATQIPLMAQIFRNANKVQAWVGGGTQEEMGMRYLSHLSRFDSVLLEHPSIMRPASNAIQSPSLESLPTVQRFLELPWFNRLWIVQEIVFNNDVELTCCNSALSWSRLVSALKTIHSPDSRVWISQERNFALNQVARLWRRHCLVLDRSEDDERPETILDVTDTFTHYGCSDARDRIYALYSMTPDVSPTNTIRTRVDMLLGHKSVLMDIDYSLDVQETYRIFALACINGGHTMQVLTMALSRSSQPTEDWPSWVPDWRKAGAFMLIPITEISSNISLDQGALRGFQGDPRKSMILPITINYLAGVQSYMHSLRINEILQTDASREAVFRNHQKPSVRTTPQALVDMMQRLSYVLQRWPTYDFGPATLQQYLVFFATHLDVNSLPEEASLPDAPLKTPQSLRAALPNRFFYCFSRRQIPSTSRVPKGRVFRIQQLGHACRRSTLAIQQHSSDMQRHRLSRPNTSATV